MGPHNTRGLPQDYQSAWGPARPIGQHGPSRRPADNFPLSAYFLLNICNLLLMYPKSSKY